MENYNRIVIDLYKECFSNYANGVAVNQDKIFDVQKQLNFAIDKAIIHNEPADDFEALKNDVLYLKYELLQDEQPR